MSSISLHKTKGVNPRLTFCPNCGGEGPDIVLLGSRERKVTCDKCGCVNYGSSRAGKCGSEGAIKANASLAKEVRKQLGIEPPKPCGVELESCPACEENAK